MSSIIHNNGIDDSGNQAPVKQDLVAGAAKVAQYASDGAGGTVAVLGATGQEGANKIAAITLSGASQPTAAIPETTVIVYNGSDAVIFIEAGAGATAVTDTSQALATLKSVPITKSANSEIAVIGAGTGKVHFSPQVVIA